MSKDRLWIAAVAGLALAGAAAAADRVVLDETCCWRQYYCFGKSQYSPAALKAGGERVVGQGLYRRLQRDTERALREAGRDPRQVDWRDHAYCAMRGARAFNPFPTPPPPADWAAPGFDDGAWVRLRQPFQGGRTLQVTAPVLGQYEEAVDLRLKTACYRARFLVDDPARAGRLTVEVEYSGGARVLVNGRELVRGHLPEGALSADTPGADYPTEAYGEEGARLCRRRIRPVAIPPQHLREGVNVLAVEIRASHFHPVVARNRIQPNWGGPKRPWPHARLFRVALRASGTGVRRATARPAGVQVWVEDVHHRTLSTDFLPPGEPAGVVRFVGVRSGTVSAQVAVGTDRELAGLQVRPGELRQANGAGRLPASAVEVLYGVPYPLAQWTVRHLGDERGLDASFPTAAELARYARMAERGKPCLFDQLTATPPTTIPADTCRPVWLRLRLPADAAPGQYRGTVEVAATGTPPVRLPVELEVVGWRLPEPKRFQTLVGCEQNPYGVAKQYGVALWSDEHFRLLDASFRQLGRIGNGWLNVPVLVRTEFGNHGDSMIRWIRKRDGSLRFDYAVLDRYLDLALEHWGRPRVVQFVVMQGMKSPTMPPTPPQVVVLDEATGRRALHAVGAAIGQPKPRRPTDWRPPPPKGETRVARLPQGAWHAFATKLHAHMKTRGLDKSMFWGAPWEQEADPSLKATLARATPGVFWTAGGHEIMANAKYCKDTRFYRIITDIRYHGGWQSFRDDQGWRSPIVHLANPRAGGTSFALHTTSLPFAYRLMVDRALAQGRTGFTRVGADEWAGIHYDGMDVPRWLTGMPVLFLLWPGPRGAETSARFEALLEGIQETEARIFIEQALHGGRVPQALARRARKVLKGHFDETNFVQGNSIIHSMEAYSYGWQARSRRLYAMAAEVARAGGEARR